MADNDSSTLPVAWPLLNDTSLVLLALTVALGVYATYFVRPRPLVHPLLLGRQSEVSPTREKGKSGVYRSFAAGHGPPLAVRPASALKTLANVLDPSCTARFVYGEKISNDLLRLRARNVGKGLHKLLRLDAVSSGAGGIVNLLPDGFDSVLLTLGLASVPSPTHPLVSLAAPHLLAHVLDMPTAPVAIVLPARLAEAVLEQLIDEGPRSDAPKPVLVVVGAEDEAAGVFSLVDQYGVVAVAWRDIEVTGNSVEDAAERPVAGEQDVFGLRIWETLGGKVQETPLTHVALTAGIAGLLALFPAHKRPSPASGDTVASCLSLDTPVGLALMLASLWSGAGFRTFGAVNRWDQAANDDDESEARLPVTPVDDLASALLPNATKPTLLFSNAPQLAALTQAIEEAAKRSPLYAVARRQKLSGLSEGFLSREGILEKYFWSGVCRNVLGGLSSSLRAVIVVDGGLTPTLLQSARVHLATPITNLTTSAQSTTPVFVTHFHDLQTVPSVQAPSVGQRELQFTPTSSVAFDKAKPRIVPGELVLTQEGAAHTGPPAVNIEVRLDGVNDDQVEDGMEDPQGEVWIRGPGVLAAGWTKTDLQAQALKNGTFLLL